MDSNDSIRGRLKSDLSSKGWWYGAIGGVLSTVIGIALTFGVSAWISHRNDRQHAREMMFNIVSLVRFNGDAVAQYDSLFSSHLNSTNLLVDIYHRTNDFENLDSLTDDTIRKCIVNLWTYNEISVPYIGTEKYFYNAETMHQFGNSAVYSYFCSVVQYDHQTYEDICKLQKLWQDFSGKMDFKNRVLNNKLTEQQLLTEMIEDYSLINYANNIRNENLPYRVRAYKILYKNLLKAMGATEDDYENYLRSLVISDKQDQGAGHP